MSLAYLPEHAEPARLALALARREVAHLDYTHRTLFAQEITVAWVQALAEREDLAEKVDAFVSRFGRLQDQIGEKLIPRFAVLLGETPKSLLDVLNFAERMGWIVDAGAFIRARRLRNMLVHEYMFDSTLFLETLQAADRATHMLMGVVTTITAYAETIGLVPP